jgi:hypothetical protein
MSAARRQAGHEEPDPPKLLRLPRSSAERRDERPGQRGQQEAAAIHYSMT